LRKTLRTSNRAEESWWRFPQTAIIRTRALTLGKRCGPGNKATGASSSIAGTPVPPGALGRQRITLRCPYIECCGIEVLMGDRMRQLGRLFSGEKRLRDDFSYAAERSAGSSKFSICAGILSHSLRSIGFSRTSCAPACIAALT
jgi:hypothetical protein